MKNQKLNILIIGLGNHARRIYLPAMFKFKQYFDITIHGVDLIPTQKSLESYLQEKGFIIHTTFLRPFKVKEQLPQKISSKLNKLVKEEKITGVIISTDPTTHKVYAKWALDNGLHILMDKPISTRSGVTSNKNQAKKIEDDYQEILQAYNQLQNSKNTYFLINTQRRFEAGFQKVFALIREVATRFNVPVTSIQAMHSDGVWIFPDEIVDQKCHPYNEGYGKCSHSGFHIFDIVWQFYKAGLVKEKVADLAETFTSFISPAGTLTQINQEDYSNYFPNYHQNHFRRSNLELSKIFKNYGENDAFSIIRLLKDNQNICNISINLLHNSFSRRAWMMPAKDLYKGNGRIKHQYYHIQQGPFQCIQIHNYQANDKQDNSNLKDYDLGGNNHFDIYVFRNAEMFGKGQKPLEVISLRDLVSVKDTDHTKLYHETAKDKVVLEFLLCMIGKIKKENVTSCITTYQIPVQIMSSIYQSHINYVAGQNPLIKFKITNND